MKREEERLEQAKFYKDKGVKDPHIHFLRGAEWADRTMIENACEWLDCYIDNYLFIDAENKAGIKWDDFINDFRKAMKGE